MINNKEHWMKLALREAEKAYKADEVPIGSIIIKDDKVIGRGHNQVESLNDCTAHSEIISITSASNSLGDWRLNDCSIYVTKEPCLMCFGSILNSRINNLYFGIGDESNGFRSKIKKSDLFDNQHLVLIESGIMKHDCQSIIKSFFIDKRKNKHKNSDE